MSTRQRGSSRPLNKLDIFTLRLDVDCANGFPILVAGGAGVLALVAWADGGDAESHVSGVGVVGHLRQQEAVRAVHAIPISWLYYTHVILI